MLTPEKQEVSRLIRTIPKPLLPDIREKNGRYCRFLRGTAAAEAACPMEVLSEALFPLKSIVRFFGILPPKFQYGVLYVGAGLMEYAEAHQLVSYWYIKPESDGTTSDEDSEDETPTSGSRISRPQTLQNVFEHMQQKLGLKELKGSSMVITTGENPESGEIVEFLRLTTNYDSKDPALAVEEARKFCEELGSQTTPQWFRVISRKEFYWTNTAKK